MKIFSPRFAATLWAAALCVGSLSLGVATAQIAPNADRATVIAKKVLSLEGAQRVLAAAVAVFEGAPA